MLDDLLAALSDDGSDPFLGLTCDVPFVRRSVAGGLCPVCAARLDRSREAVRSLSLPCSALGCGFVQFPHRESR
jgi:hypothetical protein